jgi:hypothetical protein
MPERDVVSTPTPPPAGQHFPDGGGRVHAGSREGCWLCDPPTGRVGSGEPKVDLEAVYEGPRIGQVNFGGGRAEQYLGDGGWLTFREDERTCPLLRYGREHEPHQFDYVYTRPANLGGITTGRTYCDGLSEDAQPYPLCPLGTGVDHV